MKETKVKCIRNESKSFDYVVGETYIATNEGKGILSIADSDGGFILAPLNGYYLEFEEVK